MTKNHYSFIDCDRHGPKDFIFKAHHNGRDKVASVKRNTFQEWRLQVSAGEDVLLFIGITCAIGCMSYEEAKRRKKKNEWVALLFLCILLCVCSFSSKDSYHFGNL